MRLRSGTLSFRGEAMPVEPDPGIGTPLTLARVLTSGHSLSAQPNEGMSELIAESLDLTYEWERQNTGGSTIFGRTEPPSWSGFSTGQSKFGNNIMDYLDELEDPTSVTGPYTHLCITENHSIVGNLQFSDTVRVLKAYYDAFMSRVPDGQVYLWSCWKDGPTGINASTVEDWLAFERAMTPVWGGITARINLTLANEGASHRLKNGPMQHALLELVDQAIHGTVPGITQGTVADTLEVLFRDDWVHLYAACGRYFLSCVEHAVVFRSSPVGADYPTSGTYGDGTARAITLEQATSLQQIAWDAVVDYHQNVEDTPSMAEMRAYMNDTACSAYWTFLGNPGAASGAATFFNRTTYEESGGAINPFYFDAATDAAIWHTAP